MTVCNQDDRRRNLVAEKTREYELVMILNPEATEDEIKSVVERINGLVTSNKGSVETNDVWGLRRLAYPIETHRQGNYVLTRFSSEPDVLKEVNRALNGSEDIIRFLVTKVEAQGKVEAQAKVEAQDNPES